MYLAYLKNTHLPSGVLNFFLDHSSLRDAVEWRVAAVFRTLSACFALLGPYAL
jgi:hypothetical protein